MLKKLMNLAVLFVVAVVALTPVSDSFNTAIEAAIPIIIGITITRLYGKDILVADNTALRIKNILSVVSVMTTLLLLVAVCIVKIEELDYTYIELDDAITAMIIFGIFGVILELIGSGVIKLIRHFTGKSCK